MEENQIFSKKEIKIIAILIPLVGVLIAMAFLISGIQSPEVFKIYYVISSIISTTLIWLGCTFIVAYLWRKFPWEKYPARHLIIEVLFITCYLILLTFLSYLLLKKINIFPEIANEHLSIGQFLVTLLITYFITSIHEAIYFYKQWKLNFSKSARLEKDNIEAKYETLKSQINPHFLFNSLNSLALIVDENQEATNYIQNLSEFLRYVLKSRDRELVLVRDEIQILEKYFSLQKSRFRENLIVKLDVDEKFYHYSLPPLVLQMLVENCIKHNIISKDKPLTIKVKADRESIIIENNFQKKTTEISTRQGLKNITDRFAFFTSRDVKIIENSSIFKVEIPLLKVEF